MPQFLCLVALTALVVAPVSAQSSDPTPKLSHSQRRVPDHRAPALTVEPYSFKLRDGSILAAELGRFEVPERRSDPTSRRISIGFVRFRSTNPHPGPPIVYLAGGPGGSGVDAAKGPRQSIFLALRAIGDVIALDQRGTGLSNAIPPCSADAALDPAGGLSEAALTTYYRATFVTCVRKWRAAGVTVEGYTTPENADDLEDLRRALSVPKLRLWAISYGTHLALEMMRRHPDAIDRVALASVEGMDQTVKRPAAVDAALGRLADAVSAPEEPSKRLTTVMRRVHARLDAEPQVMTVGDATGQVRFAMDAFALRMLVGGIAKNPDGIGRLAGLYAAFDAGQGQALAPLLYGAFFKDRLEMTGMPELMDLASGISKARASEVRAQAIGSIAGNATNFPMPQLSGALPAIDLGDDYRREVRSNIPALLFSGDLDVRTPLEEQAVATAGLTHLNRVIVHNAGHDVFEAHPGISGLLLAFFQGRLIGETRLDLPPPSLGAVR